MPEVGRRSWDVAVVGGGLAGAAAACRLAEAGRRVVLFEREAGPHDKVCGEFVSVEARQHLSALGLDRADGTSSSPLPLGAVAIDRMRLVAGALQAVAPLPFTAWGLSRRRLDAWLLGQAERRGVTVRRGRPVQALHADGAGARVVTAGDDPALAGAAILATGKHELRDHQRRGRPAELIGLKMRLRLSEVQARALDRHVELALFEGGYAGLQHVEDGFSNLCLLVSKERFAGVGRDWRRLVATVPHLRHRLDGASACWPRPLAVYRIPYGYLHRPEEDGGRDEAAVYRVGDQVAVIPSFTGDGMAMALHSASLASAAVLAGRPPAAFHREAGRAFRCPLLIAKLVSSLGALPWSQRLLTAACRAAPGLMTEIACRTRIRHDADVAATAA